MAELKTKEEDSVKKTSIGGKVKYADNILPMNRIKRIMKMDPNITDGISVEANYLVCAATEIFVRYLSREVYEKHQQLTYQNLSKFVLSDEKLDFLHAVVPEKITVKKYKQILAEEEQKLKNYDSEDSDISSSTEEEDNVSDDSDIEKEGSAEKVQK